MHVSKRSLPRDELPEAACLVGPGTCSTQQLLSLQGSTPSARSPPASPTPGAGLWGFFCPSAVTSGPNRLLLPVNLSSDPPWPCRPCGRPGLARHCPPSHLVLTSGLRVQVDMPTEQRGPSEVGGQGRGGATSGLCGQSCTWRGEPQLPSKKGGMDDPGGGGVTWGGP